jgi:hypothetical protein
MLDVRWGHTTQHNLVLVLELVVEGLLVAM